MRGATGSEQLSLGKFRSLWNPFGAASNLGFVVWVVYWILYALGHWTAAAMAGLAVMLVIVASENRTANVKIIDLTSLGFFVLALSMLLTVGDQVSTATTSSSYGVCSRWSRGQRYSSAFHSPSS